MTPLLRALEVDLALEHQGRLMTLRGSGGRFAARFPTLRSALVFLRVFWPYRKRLPPGIPIRFEWKRIGFTVNNRL